MGIENINKVKFQLDERSKLRAQIGLNIGITMGMTAAFVAIIISQMQLWYKLFAAFGLFCACILQLGGVLAAIARLKAYNSAMAEYAKLNTQQVPASYTG